MNKIFKNIINYIKKYKEIYHIIILFTIIFILYYIIIILFTPKNQSNIVYNKTNNSNIEPLSLPVLENINTNIENNQTSDLFHDKINIRTNNILYTQEDKNNDILLDLYNDIYTDVYSDITYDDIVDLNRKNLIRKDNMIVGGNMVEEEDNDDFLENNQKTIFSEDDDNYDNNNISNNMKITANIASTIDKEEDLILKKFKKDNIIKINDDIAIIIEIDKKNILLFYKIINNSNINDLSKTFTLDNSQINNINIIANTIEDFNIYLKNNNLINDNSMQLDNNMISFLNNKKWFPIDFKYKFTIKNKLSDVFEYIFNNINLYTNLNINDINILNTTFTKEYKDSTILINNINIDKNTLPKNMLSNIRKNIKLKLLNNISIKNFKNLKLISLVQINNYNYEKYFQDYYNIYLIISKYKLNNIKLNKNICRDLLTDYKKQCSDITLVHLEDCNKEQLKHARIKRDQINTQIQLLEENR